MVVRKAIEILSEFNKWRRGLPPYDVWGEKLPYSPTEIGEAIDCAIEKLKKNEK